MNVINRGRQIRYLAAVLALLGPLGGCGSEEAITKSEMPTTVSYAAAPAPGAVAVAARNFAPGDKAAAGGASAEVPPAMPRKIIYNGYVDLVVEDFGSIEAKVLALLEGRGGYVSESNVAGSPGSQRSGTWKLRVPAEHFAAVMAAVAKLGELRSNRTDSQDVSQEYYDIEARLEVKKQEEKRLLKILDEAAGKLKDILEVEKELSRVRSEAEQMEGRLRWLAHNAALSTIVVTVTEIKNYHPPVAPTFAQRIARAFQGSTENLGEFLMNSAVAIVAIVPWLVLIVPAAAIAWLALRRIARLARA